jgi:DNA-binding LacI/PurR family transcriptional regulator
MRPRVDIDDTTRKRVLRYARKHGYTTDRAYAELIKNGLDETDVDVAL